MKRDLKKFTLLIAIAGTIASCTPVPEPDPVGPLPSERQLAWHERQYYAFVHFNMNTFTDMEWGTGAESPEQFNPTELDARQWARVARDAGMKGIILTAKHHDGFCLWPTETTEHSVQNSPWREGKGDLVREVAEACEEFGLDFGIYLSPWDRNNAHYGSPEYVKIFHRQLEELLTGYGPIFEVWFDGANGGSGYYGGANETRKIDNRTYYQWDTTTAMVRKYQPDAVIFSDGGPDIRWVGTEEGWAGETNWSIMRRDEIYPGWERYEELRYGHEDGTHWLPAEVNTSIRPGWYYHPREDHQVKTLPRLLRTWYESIGRNGNFLLNLPVDTRGLVHEEDVKQLMALKQQVDLDFAEDLAARASASASNTRGGASRFAPAKAIDGDAGTYWATDDGVTQADLELDFGQPTAINRLLLQEFIPLGQRVQAFSVEAFLEDRWQQLDSQTTIGYKRILQFPTVETTALRIRIQKSKGPVTIRNVEVYRAPALLVPPRIRRDGDGKVRLEVPESETAVYFTLDGSAPDTTKMRYRGPFPAAGPVTVRAIAVDPASGDASEAAMEVLDVSPVAWKVVSVSSGDPTTTDALMDGDPETFWATDEEVTSRQWITIDLGRTLELHGISYWPMQERYPFGIITRFSAEASLDGRTWTKAAEGEFGNVFNNRVQQQFRFNPVTARYLRVTATEVHGGGFRASFAELGILTRPE